jgi:hypothetical protein
MTQPDLTGFGGGADTQVTLPNLTGYGFTPRMRHHWQIKLGPRIAVGHEKDRQLEVKFWTSNDNGDLLLAARWDIHRYGGCGMFEVTIGGDLTVAETAADEEWEVEISVKLEGEADYRVWYRGYVTTFWREEVKDRWQTTLRGMGYIGQLKRLQVDSTYEDFATDVIVKDLLDTYASQDVDPNSDVSYRDEDIDPGITIERLRYTGSLVRAIRQLAVYQQDVEYGVDENRWFFWHTKDLSSINHHLVERRGLIDLIQAGQQQKRSTSIKVVGETTFKTASATRSNTPTSPDQKRQRALNATGLSTPADLDGYAAGILAEYDSAQEWLGLKITEVQEAYHFGPEPNHRPLGLYRVHMVDGSVKDYNFGKIIYRIGGDLTSPEGVRTSACILGAELWLGCFSKDIGEEIEELDAEIEQLTMKFLNLRAAPPDSHYIVSAADDDLDNEHVLGTEVNMRGLAADMPPTAIDGALYSQSDTGQLKRFNADPSIGWETIADTGTLVQVTSLTGTEDQVYVNGGIGPVTGDVTLTLPQDIATDSTPQFARIGGGTAAHASIIAKFLSASAAQLQLAYDGTYYRNLTVDSASNLKLTAQADQDVDGSFEIESARTPAGLIADAYVAGLRLNPTYELTGVQAAQITRHNYIDVQNIIKNEVGGASITIDNGCVFRFDAAAGTHYAVDAGTAVTAWMKNNLDGTVFYTPMFSDPNYFYLTAAGNGYFNGTLQALRIGVGATPDASAVLNLTASGTNPFLLINESASTTGQYIKKIITADASAANYNEIFVEKTNPYGARKNTHWKWGYNIKYNSDEEEVVGEGTAVFGVEQYYAPDAGNALMEMYFEFMAPTTLAPTRTLHMQFNRVDNKSEMEFRASTMLFMSGEGWAAPEVFRITSAAAIRYAPGTHWYPSTNSTTAFNLYDAADAASIFCVDTTNGRVGINQASPTATLSIVAPNTAAMLSIANSSNSYRTVAQITQSSNHGLLRMYNASEVIGVYLTTSGTSYVSGGGFGVGTTAPSAYLGVYAPNTGGMFGITNSSNSGRSIILVTQSSNHALLRLYDASENTGIELVTGSGTCVFNEHGDNVDFRVEGDTDANLFMCDASADKVGIGVAAPSSKLDINGDLEQAAADAHYFGDPSTNGTWKFVRSGDDFVIQRRESGSYVTKFTIAAS